MREIGFRIYLITDGKSPDRVAAALSALPENAAAIQLRDHTATARELCRRGDRLREITHGRAALFVNDRVDVALSVGADGVHLPARGIPVYQAKRVTGSLLVGASTHSLPEAGMACRMGVDFVTFGPVWETASHPGAPATGIAALAEVVKACPVPVFALGGVDASRASEAVAVGARAATLGHVLGADDPAAAARAFDLGCQRRPHVV
jgi:thiamine-phosphate diphosphorylase